MGIKALRRKIASIVDRVDGQMGVAILDVLSGDEIGVSEEILYPMASVCKTPILVEAYRQVDRCKLALEDRVEVTRSSRVAGSGLLNYCSEGLNPTVSDLVLLMIVVSDNAATDLVLQRVGGPAKVTATMRKLGLNGITLDRTIKALIKAVHAKIDPAAAKLDYFKFQERLEGDHALAERFRDPERVFTAVHEATEGLDIATPRDIARLYGQIQRAECASAESCAAILKTLERQQLRGRLPRNLPAHTRCCHKTGTLGDGNVCNDTGLIYVGERPIAVAVLSKDVKQEAQETNSAIARIGRTVYDHFAG